MPHETTLIVTIVMSLVFAFGFGFIASTIRLPPLVGYLVAGIAVGPFTPGFVADGAIAAELAELGVILLMFGVGLHFSARDLMAVRWIAVPGAVGQIIIATAIGTAVAMLWGWGLGAGLVLGLALSVASTVVLLRALDERNLVATANGRIAVGWLIVEDLAMVLALVLLPAFAGLLGGTPPAGADNPSDTDLLTTIAITIAKVLAFVGIVAMLGPRIVPWLLGRVARTGSQELFTLSVLAVALGIAYGSATFFGVSFALGAFCAGVVLSESDLSHRAAAESLPLQNAFSVLFFVSVGMLFDPSIVIREPIAVAAVLAIILFGKSLAAFAIVLFLGYPMGTALIVSASLAQIGEFSFILAGLGAAFGLLPPEGRDLILAGALLSITLNPVLFALVEPLTKWLSARPSPFARAEIGRRRRLVALQQALDRAEKAAAPLSIQAGELVTKFPIFGELDIAIREELLTLLKPRSAVPGERIIRKGDEADDVFFISSGSVEVNVGDRKIVLNPGDFFGEMALLSGGRRTADVTAIDYCQFLTLDKRDFRSFVKKHPALRAKLDDVAARRDEMNRLMPQEASTEI